MDNNTVPQKPVNPTEGSAQPVDAHEPVAYDKQGRPLYLHPPANPDAVAAPVVPAPTPTQAQPAVPPQPQMVYMARPMNPEDLHIPEEVVARHDESTKKYPFLNLSNGEYVISAVRRHPIGLLRIWAAALTAGLIFTVMALLFLNNAQATDSNIQGLPAAVAAGLVFLYFLIFLGAWAATYIYQNNKFFMTNESVIQEIQQSLFAKHEQTVSLGNIEDASFRQNNIFQSIFNYGTIRLSTEGDETTYVFHYVANPKQHIALLNNAVEAFKNGRPVEG
jgi:hypothetical protein